MGTWRLEPMPEQGSSMYRAVFRVPVGFEDYFLTKPVMTRGAAFSFDRGPEQVGREAGSGEEGG